MSEGQFKLVKLVKPKKKVVKGPSDATNLKRLREAWQDARIRLIAGELVEGSRITLQTVIDNRMSLDAEAYRQDDYRNRQDATDMFQRHNETSTRLALIEERMVDAERRITSLQNILVRHGLARVVTP